MRRAIGRPAGVVLLLGLLAATAACGESTGASSTDPIDIVFSDGSVTPNGERVDVSAGQPFELVVEAETPGRLHVHSDPEQVFDFDQGTTDLEVMIERPGVVEVESHELDTVILQLEVR